MNSSVESQLPPQVVEAVRRTNAATSKVERWKRIGILYCAALLTVITPITVVSTFNGSSTLAAVRAAQIESIARGVDIKASSANSEKILQTLQGCLSPEGKCYQRSKADQADVIAQLSRLWTYAGLCLQNPSVPLNTRAQQDCVAQLIQEHGQ